MNKPEFALVVPCYLLNEKEMDVAARAFLRFFQSVTHRHQRRSRFLAIGATESQRDLLEFFWQKTELPGTALVHFESRETAREFVGEAESLLLLATQRVGDAIRVEAISWGLPTVTFENWERARTFDAGFCIFMAQGLEDQAVREFGSLVRMLYFDTGALAMLRQKAGGLRRPSQILERV